MLSKKLLVLILKSKLRADVVFLAGMSALFVSGVLDIKGAFGGLISPSVLVIAAIYAVIAGLNHTGVLNWIVKHLMGSPKTITGAIVRTMLPVALLSSILTNTTVVALFIDVGNGRHLHLDRNTHKPHRVGTVH